MCILFVIIVLLTIIGVVNHGMLLEITGYAAKLVHDAFQLEGEDPCITLWMILTLLVLGKFMATSLA